MKKRILLILLLFQQATYGQQMLGIANSNFAGSAGMNLNPASMLYMPYQWEATLMNFNVSFDNDYLSYSAEKNTIKTDGTSPDNHGGLIADDSPGDKSGHLHGMLKAPSFIYRTKKFAIGIHSAIRNDACIRQVPAALAKYFYEGQYYKPLHGQSIDLAGMHGGAMTWAEIGLSFGKVLHQDEENNLLVAATFNYITAIQGTYFRVNSGNFNIVNDTLAFPNDLNAEFNSASLDGPAHLISSPPGNGFGIDFGISYVSNPYEGKGKMNDATNKKYNYRIGVSLLDFGLVSFTRNASTYHYNLSVLNLNNIENVDSLIESGYSGDKFMMGLPSALSLQYDYCLVPRWYLNFTAVQRVPLFMAQVDRPNQFAASLRYETTKFEIGVPYSLYEYSQLRIGLAIRFRYIFLGTDKLGTFVHINDDSISGGDFYFGLKLNNFDFRKKPKSRKPCVAFF